jgi:3-hydroxyacyl-CoA dehydrogenase/enoyl-CoA hydratase/3-hydroxybutyryl-CoA epimerase
VMEGAAMLGEGIPAAVIENAAMQAGMPVGPLAVLDETALTLSVQVLEQTRADWAAQGQTYEATAGELLVERMVKQHRRGGRAAGSGFYDYPAGQAKHLWPGLRDLFESAASRWNVKDIQDRLLYRQAVETARCLHEGVLGTVHEANIASIFGIGFPVWTGGALQFIYRQGVSQFAQRCAELADRHGAGFKLDQSVITCLQAHRPSW